MLKTFYLILKVNIIKVDSYIAIVNEIIDKTRFLKSREDLEDREVIYNILSADVITKSKG